MMTTIRELFDQSRPIDRRIEKVITYGSSNEVFLKQEIQEYVVTHSIEEDLEKVLDRLDEGMSGDAHNVEVGVWVSGFYGSGKSSFTKYLGFALDQSNQLYGKPAVVVGNSVGDVFEANGGEVRSDASLVSPNFVSTDNYYLRIRPCRASDCSMIYSNAAPFFEMTRIY
jgi:hypothetical protein